MLFQEDLRTWYSVAIVLRFLLSEGFGGGLGRVAAKG
jgi:hypothetical protein